MGGQNPEGRSQVSYVNALEGLNFDDGALLGKLANGILCGDLQLFVLDVASWRNDQEQVQTDYTGLQRLLTNAVGKAKGDRERFHGGVAGEGLGVRVPPRLRRSRGSAGLEPA